MISCPLPRPDARVRLFCFPHAGSGVAQFHPWAHLLPAHVELRAVQLPGRESRLREAPFHSVGEAIQPIVEALLPHLDRPFGFFGHSMGALLGFEVARYLRRRRSLEPSLLFVSGRRAPHDPDPDSPIHQLPDAALVEALQHRYSGLPEVLLRDAELLKLYLAIVRADLEVVETYAYTPEEPLGCPISGFGGTHDRRVSQRDLAGWREHTNASFILRMLPGNHFYLNGERSQLVQHIASDLEELLRTPHVS